MKKSLLLISGGILAFTLSGCETRIADFTALSSKNIDWSHASEFERSPLRVEGKDSVGIIVFIPTKAKIDVKEAVDKAIEKTPGAVALVDGTIYRSSFWFIFGEEAVRVEGTPLIDPYLLGKPMKPASALPAK